MKTTLDIPDPLFRQAKARAALAGISLRQLVAEALQEKLANPQLGRASGSEPPWMRGFGSLAALRNETRAVERRIAQAFEQVEDDGRV